MSRTRSTVATALVLVLFLVGCGSAGNPVSYDDQPDPETGISNVEANWMEGCRVAFDEELADEANAVCACSYSRIRADIPFDEFVEMNDRLAANANSLAEAAANPDSTEAAVIDIVKNCIAEG